MLCKANWISTSSTELLNLYEFVAFMSDVNNEARWTRDESIRGLYSQVCWSHSEAPYPLCWRILGVIYGVPISVYFKSLVSNTIDHTWLIGWTWVIVFQHVPTCPYPKPCPRTKPGSTVGTKRRCLPTCGQWRHARALLCSGCCRYTRLYTIDSFWFILYIFWGFLNRCKIITCAGGAWVIDTLHLHMHANYYLQIIGMNELYNIFMSSTNVVLPGALSVEAWWYGPDQVLFKGQGCWWNICSTIEGWIGLMWIQSSFKSTNSLATWNHTMLKCYACVVWGGSLCNSIRGEFRITTQHI